MTAQKIPNHVYSQDLSKLTSSNVVSHSAFSACRVDQPLHSWHDAIMNKLNELAKLERGWDGYTGLPVSFENANFAFELLNQLGAACGNKAPPPQIVPGSNGDLQIEWHTEHADIELYVQAPYKVHAWRATQSTGELGEEINLTNDFLIVAKWITEISEPAIAAQSTAA